MLVLCPFLYLYSTKLTAILARLDDLLELSKLLSEARNATFVTTDSTIGFFSPRTLIIRFSAIRVTESVTSICVPIGIFINVLMVFGSLLGKKTTFGFTILFKTIINTKRTIIPPRIYPGLLPFNTHARVFSYLLISAGRTRS